MVPCKISVGVDNHTTNQNVKLKLFIHINMYIYISTPKLSTAPLSEKIYKIYLRLIQY